MNSKMNIVQTTNKLYSKKHSDNANNSNSWSKNSWESQRPAGLFFMEGQIIDARELHQREDDDGNFVKISDDTEVENLCIAFSRPSSQGSVLGAMRNQRGYPLLIKLGQNWMDSIVKAEFWKRAVCVDMTDQQMKNVARGLALIYKENGINPQSLYEWIDQEEQVKRDARMLRHGNRAKQPLIPQVYQPPTDAEIENPFVKEFTEFDRRKRTRASPETSPRADVGNGATASASGTGNSAVAAATTGVRSLVLPLPASTDVAMTAPEGDRDL